MGSSETVVKQRGDKVKIYENRAKMSKNLLGKSGLMSNKDDATNDENNNENEGSNNDNVKTFWNISNDDYYNPKVLTETQTTNKHVSTSLVLQHTQSSLELYSSFYPTHLTTQKLRNFHRYALKRIVNAALTTDSTFLPLNYLLKRKFQSQSQLPLINEFISVRTSPNDLSSTDNCEIILAEYSEQYPPLMMQTGMASKVRNYYKRRFAKDDGPVKSLIEYGEFVYINTSPFLGSLKPGDYLQSLENYMFRAPIYSHQMAPHDFLCVRTRNLSYMIRSDVKSIFVVGQECPLIEVPGPNSKRANSFIKDFLQAFIYRQFARSRDRTIKMEDIKKAFPTHTESSIRKRLKVISDLKRTTGRQDIETNWWILKEDFRLTSEEEIRAMISPEQCCAYYSMLAAEQRLKDAGYGEKNLLLRTMMMSIILKLTMK
jgi:transcription initiation factor TFIID subunit 1